MPVLGEGYAQLKQWIGDNHKTLGIVLGGVVIVVKVLPAIMEKASEIQTQNALKKWEPGPKDVVVFHTLSRGKTVPNLSPFAMKLETYLRIAQIPYQVDFDMPMGPVGKTPWISLNGEHVADSQLIIKYLNKKLNVKIGSYTEEQRAVAKAVRIMMDEYMYWGVGLWRYVHSEGKGLNQIFDLPPFALKVFYKMVNQRIKEFSYAQGIGRHSKEDVTEMMKEVLKTCSLLVGSKPFLLGEEPCEEDCALFGMLSMVRWATPGSPYEAYMNEELTNLKEYCERMKTLAWTDWEQCLASPN